MPRLTVVTGGQTGVDRAALDAAVSFGVAVEGWCPRGRRAEDGPLDVRYPLQETPSDDYGQRTRWNVRDSDGTLVLTRATLLGGTALTVEEARRLGRPLWQASPEPAQVAGVVRWVREAGINRLNVAGPRESEAPGIYNDALLFLNELFRALIDSP